MRNQNKDRKSLFIEVSVVQPALEHGTEALLRSLLKTNSLPMKYEHFFYDWNPSFFRGFESSISLQPFISSDLPVCVIFSNLSCFFMNVPNVIYPDVQSLRKVSHSGQHKLFHTHRKLYFFQLQVIKWKFHLLQWYLSCWLRICMTGHPVAPRGLLRINTMHFSLLTLLFFSRNISTHVVICSILLVYVAAIKGKNTAHCRYSRADVLTALLLKNQVLLDKTLCF